MVCCGTVWPSNRVMQYNRLKTSDRRFLTVCMVYGTGLRDILLRLLNLKDRNCPISYFECCWDSCVSPNKTLDLRQSSASCGKLLNLPFEWLCSTSANWVTNKTWTKQGWRFCNGNICWNYLFRKTKYFMHTKRTQL